MLDAPEPQAGVTRQTQGDGSEHGGQGANGERDGRGDRQGPVALAGGHHEEGDQGLTGPQHEDGEEHPEGGARDAHVVVRMRVVGVPVDVQVAAVFVQCQSRAAAPGQAHTPDHVGEAEGEERPGGPGAAARLGGLEGSNAVPQRDAQSAQHE